MLSALLQKLLFINQFTIKEGKIEILGNRHIMLSASSLLKLQEVDETKMYSLMKDLSQGNMKTTIEHAKVYKGLKDVSLKNIAELSEKVGKSADGIIKTIQSLFELYGLGKMTVLNLDNAKKSVSIQIDESTIALEKKKKDGKADKVICTITSGVLAGIFSYVFKKDVDCVEKKCLACGETSCIFLVQ